MASSVAASIAGPAAVLSWVIGAGAVLLIGLTIAEIGTVFPQSGGMARYMQHTHGALAGFISAWLNWLGIVATIPTEASASVEYLSGRESLAFLTDPATHQMTTAGLIAASGLVVFYFLLNFGALTLFVRAMSAITVFKLVVPLFTGVSLMAVSFHADNFTADPGGFMPYGWPAVLTAVSAGGSSSPSTDSRPSSIWLARPKTPRARSRSPSSRRCWCAWASIWSCRSRSSARWRRRIFSPAGTRSTSLRPSSSWRSPST